MKQNLKYAPLSKFIEINPENLSKNYPYIEIEYIDISSVASGYLNEKPKTLTLANAPSRAKRIVRENDSILATVRPNLRSFLYITNPKANTIVSTGFAVLRAKNKVDPRFIYYAITNPVFTGYLTNNAKGTSYPAVDTDIILRGEIADFPYITQQKIADILSKYDNLIENNRRRIELLEESARLLYREWFVYLRFPGHEHTPIIDGIPEGWEKGKISDLGEVITGKTPSKQKTSNFDGKIPFVKTPDMHNQVLTITTQETLSEEGANSQPKKFITRGSVMVSCIGTVGIVSMSSSTCQTNQQINSIVFSDKLLAYYSFFLLKDIKPRLEAMGGGSTMLNINKQKFSSISILISSKQLIDLFAENVKPSFEQIEKLSLMNQKLQQARDILIPRLMNGEIAV